jgi:hyperosmotically inducible periplasmic protein
MAAQMKTIVRRSILSFLMIPLALIAAMTTGTSAFAGTKDKTPIANGSPQYEAWLTKQVRHQLVMLPWYSVYDNLEYKVEGNKVTLSGAVVLSVLKDDAANAVKHVEGVEAVENNIEVLPASEFDEQIRREELRAIYNYPTLQRYGWGTMPSIHIIVKNGHVTLEGVVSDETDKNVANIRANAVASVFSLTNNLRVEKS